MRRDTEIRTRADIATRADNNRMRIGGYAAVFNTRSRNLGGFVEVIDPRAFNMSRGLGWPRVVARYNHEHNYLLGTTKAGTLRLNIDRTGLDYEVDIPTVHTGIHELVARGDVTESSFAFRATEDDWTTNEHGTPERRVLVAELLDVAPVNDPAYADATVGLRGYANGAYRSLAAKAGASYEEVRSAAHTGSLARFLPRRITGHSALIDLHHRNSGPPQPATAPTTGREALRLLADKST